MQVSSNIALMLTLPRNQAKKIESGGLRDTVACWYLADSKFLQMIVDMQDMRNGVIGFVQQAKSEVRF